MADLIVTFVTGSRNGAAIPDQAKTEAITIGMESAQGELESNYSYRHVHLKALAACWVAIGTDPIAAPKPDVVPSPQSPPESPPAPIPQQDSFYLGSGERLEFYLDGNSQKVAVIAAA